MKFNCRVGVGKKVVNREFDLRGVGTVDLAKWSIIERLARENIKEGRGPKKPRHVFIGPIVPHNFRKSK